MSNETMTSVDALNVNTPEPAIVEPKPEPKQRKPRVMANKQPSAADLQKQINDLRAAKRAALEAERKNKPARRSRDSGNTWQIKLAAADLPRGKIDEVFAAVKPKLTKNAHGMLPTVATVGTIRTDFYHSMRVFKSLSPAKRDKLLAAI
jgi:hypothetical protein